MGNTPVLPKILSSTKEERSREQRTGTLSKVRGRDHVAAWLEGEVADGVCCGRGQKDAHGEENAYLGRHAGSFLLHQFSAAMGRGLTQAYLAQTGTQLPRCRTDLLSHVLLVKRFVIQESPRAKLATPITKSQRRGWKANPPQKLIS